MNKYFFLPLIILFFLACSAENKNNNASSEKTTKIEKEAPEMSSPSMKMRGYELTPFAPSQAYADAEIKNYEYKDGKFTFELADGDYKLGKQTPDAPSKMCANSAKGQHIHLIIDNKPYAAKYTSEFDYEISDGEHYLLAFLSRSYHESIKTPKAYVADKITVKDGSIVKKEAVKEPMLFYSRPKGTYTGLAETEKVMLDYYLVNASTEEGYSVRTIVNGKAKFVLDKWQPYYIEGLGIGENSIELSLLGPDGKNVESPILPVQRTFELKTIPTE